MCLGGVWARQQKKDCYLYYHRSAHNRTQTTTHKPPTTIMSASRTTIFKSRFAEKSKSKRKATPEEVEAATKKFEGALEKVKEVRKRKAPLVHAQAKRVKEELEKLMKLDQEILDELDADTDEMIIYGGEGIFDAYCADVDLEYAPEGTSFQAALTMIEEVITASAAPAIGDDK